MKEFKQPFEELLWANTQKWGPGNVRDRWRLLGAVMGPDDELAIIRHPIDSLPPGMQTEATVGSQTGLNIIIADTRNVVALKLTNDGGGSGDYLQAIGSDGVVDAKITSSGAFMQVSARELKQKMKQLPDRQVKSILEKMKIYQYEYIKEPGVKYVGAEAGEFKELTKLGDSTSIAPMSMAALAFRAVKFVYELLLDLDKRITKLELKKGGEDIDKV